MSERITLSPDYGHKSCLSDSDGSSLENVNCKYCSSLFMMDLSRL